MCDPSNELLQREGEYFSHSIVSKWRRKFNSKHKPEIESMPQRTKDQRHFLSLCVCVCVWHVFGHDRKCDIADQWP